MSRWSWVASPVQELSRTPNGSRDLIQVVLHPGQPLSPALVTNALAVQGTYREYQQRALARTGLRRMYVGTLTLTVVLAVFGFILGALAAFPDVGRIIECHRE